MIKLNDDGTFRYVDDSLESDSERIRRMIANPTLIENPINMADTEPFGLNSRIRVPDVDWGLSNMINTVPEPIETVDNKQELLDVIHNIVEEEREEMKKEIIKEIKNEIRSKRKTKKTKSKTKRKSDVGTLSMAIEEIMNLLTNDVIPYTDDLRFLHRKNKEKARDIATD